MITKPKPFLKDPEYIARGNRARQLLTYEAFDEAIKDVEDDLWRGFFKSNIKDEKEREMIYAHINALALIVNKIETLWILRKLQFNDRLN